MKTYLGIILLSGIFMLAACSDDDKTPSAIASFDIIGSPGYAPASITCINTSQNSHRYEWYVDNVGPDVSNPLFLGYYTSGNHKVTLRAYGTESVSEVTKWVYVNPPHTVCKIKKIELISFPPHFSGSWDPGSGPDVFYEIEEVAGSLLYDGLPFKVDNLTTSSLPVIWDHALSVTLGPLTSTHHIYFYDYDAPDPNAFIGYIDFKPSHDWKFYPVNPVMESNGLKVRFTLEWE